MLFYGIDPLYILMMLPVIIISMTAQWKVKSSFKKFSKYGINSGLTGAEAARIILSKSGVNDVRVEGARGFLSDHYSPRERVLRLSTDVFNSNSIAAVGVAAHEAGHALQHNRGMLIMRVWQALAMPASIMSNAAIWLIIIGSILHMMFLAQVGFIFFLGVVVFQLLTLPLEFDASNRAKKLLSEYRIVSSEAEASGVSSVLNSAAMTYVAAAAASIVQLLYFALRLGLLRSRD